MDLKWLFSPTSPLLVGYKTRNYIATIFSGMYIIYEGPKLEA